MPLEFLAKFLELSFNNPVIVGLGVGVVRTFWGWLENAAKDGRISGFEVRQLIETMCRVIPQAIGLMAFGLPAEAALGTDMFYKAIKGARKK